MLISCLVFIVIQLYRTQKITVFENHRKSRISTLRAKRAMFTFWVDKSWFEMQKMFNLATFWKLEACGQTVLPDRSILIGPKLVTFLVIFKHCKKAWCTCREYLRIIKLVDVTFNHCACKKGSPYIIKNQYEKRHEKSWKEEAFPLYEVKKKFGI